LILKEKKQKLILAQKGKNKANEEDGKGEKKQETQTKKPTRQSIINRGHIAVYNYETDSWEDMGPPDTDLGYKTNDGAPVAIPNSNKSDGIVESDKVKSCSIYFRG
jgi:hypothetical protein